MDMKLSQLVQSYLAVAGEYGKPIPLVSLQFPKEELERVFSAFDEDYHISRFFHFACAAAAGEPDIYQINFFPQTHVSIDADIQSIL